MIERENRKKRNNMGDDCSLEDLREEYYKYKEKQYEFGRYKSEYQIQKAFDKGKIFVLKGGIRGTSWLLLFCTFCMDLLPGVLILFTNVELGLVMLYLWLIVSSFVFLKLRNLLVISPKGVYYRKYLNSGFFSWNDVEFIRGETGSYKRFKWEIVTIYDYYGNQIKLESYEYLNKEFEKRIEREMFLDLFLVYSGLNDKKSHKTSSNSRQMEEKSRVPSVSKFPPLSELLNKTQSSLQKDVDKYNNGS